MRGGISIKVLCVGAMLLLLAGCKTRKEWGEVLVEGERYVSRSEAAAIKRSVGHARMDYNTFIGRAKSTFQLNKDIHDVTTHVRIRKDEAIWVSVTAVLGMEVARVLITPDRIRIINRMQSVYVDQPFDYIHRFASKQLDFQALEDLLVGEVLQSLVDNNTQVTAFDDGYVLRGEQGGLEYELTLDPTHRIRFTTLEEPDMEQRLTAMYESRATFSGRVFPQVLQLAMLAKGLDLQIDMAYNRATFDEPVETPFTIPPRFTEVR